MCENERKWWSHRNTARCSNSLFSCAYIVHTTVTSTSTSVSMCHQSRASRKRSSFESLNEWTQFDWQGSFRTANTVDDNFEPVNLRDNAKYIMRKSETFASSTFYFLVYVISQFFLFQNWWLFLFSRNQNYLFCEVTNVQRPFHLSGFYFQVYIGHIWFSNTNSVITFVSSSSHSKCWNFCVYSWSLRAVCWQWKPTGNRVWLGEKTLWKANFRIMLKFGISIPLECVAWDQLSEIDTY